MPDQLSNPNNEDEQVINTQADNDADVTALFNAAYSGNTDDVNRLSESVADEVVEDDTTTDENVSEDGQVNEAAVSIEPGSETVDEATPATPQDSSAEEIARLKEELHRAKSDAGRLPFLNRRVQELERQLTKVPSPAAKPGETEELPPHLKEKIARMREIDPDNADLMEEIYRANAAKAAEVANAFNTAQQLAAEREEEEYVRSEYNKVVNAIPEAEAVFRSSEWKQWVGMLTPNHRAMAESSNANEVITALQAFAVDAERHLGGYKWKATPAVNTATTPEPQVSATARAAETSRAARLSSSATVKGSAARATAELDAEALFKEAYEKVRVSNTL